MRRYQFTPQAAERQKAEGRKQKAAGGGDILSGGWHACEEPPPSRLPSGKQMLFVLTPES